MTSGRPSAGAPAGGPAVDPGRHEESPWPHVEVRGELARAKKEWLHTNGAGAYASSTLACMHTRRYHGLLVAALDPPRRRHVMLSHVDVSVRPAGNRAPAHNERRAPRQKWDLGKHQFPEVDPEGSPFYLDRFDQDPLPRWTHAVAGAELEITLGLVRGENAVVLRYAWRGPAPVLLTLRPLLAVRHIHTLLRENGGMSQKVELRAGWTRPERAGREPSSFSEVRVQPSRALPRICFRFQGTFVGSPDWWRRFEYLAERDRGLDFQEDLWTPGHLELVAGATPAYLVIAIDSLPAGEPEAMLAAAAAALRAEDPGPERSILERRLRIAAESFRADGAQRPGVIAGYPWFEVWGRDTLIALPGLYLVTGKVEGAMRVIREMINAMRDGVVPSRLPDAGEPAEFHAGDATLWLFEAARLIADALGETHPFVTEELLLALRDAFEAAQRGGRNGVHITTDGLFAAGRPGAGGADALTWMDARVAGRAVTPRAGCPVELSALWARGSDTLSRLAGAAGDQRLSERAAAAATAARRGFRARFWCEETGYPYDVISENAEGEGAFRDPSIRPNAVIALAIEPACFTPEQAASLLERARLELVTPAGLRTLSPADPAYMPRYEGGPAARDAAYHQGTVWPFLLGFYARAAKRSSALGEHVLPLLHRLVASAAANELALGSVSEIASGEAPHHPGGCVARAWSVAELLRVVAWDLPGAEPGDAAEGPPR